MPTSWLPLDQAEGPYTLEANESSSPGPPHPPHSPTTPSPTLLPWTEPSCCPGGSNTVTGPCSAPGASPCCGACALPGLLPVPLCLLLCCSPGSSTSLPSFCLQSCPPPSQGVHSPCPSPPSLLIPLPSAGSIWLNALESSTRVLRDPSPPRMRNSGLSLLTCSPHCPRVLGMSPPAPGISLDFRH